MFTFCFVKKHFTIVKVHLNIRHRPNYACVCFVVPAPVGKRGKIQFISNLIHL